MTAASDYPLLADFASRPSGHVATLNAKRREARAALDEIERLRAALRWALDCGAQTYDTDSDGAVWAYSCGCCAERTPVPDDLRDTFKATFHTEESPC